MLCQECGMEGRWWRRESGAWRDIHAARGLANPKPVAATELDRLRAENARLRKVFDAVIALAENAPCPGEADETESGHRYAQGYRDASCAAAETLRELTAKIIALAPQEPNHG